MQNISTSTNTYVGVCSHLDERRFRVGHELVKGERVAHVVVGEVRPQLRLGLP